MLPNKGLNRIKHLSSSNIIHGSFMYKICLVLLSLSMHTTFFNDTANNLRRFTQMLLLPAKDA